MYYPLNNDPVQFVAYCPYKAAATTNHTVTYNFSDQSTQAKKEAVDFIFHKDETPYQKDPLTDVVLDFHHKFSKIRIHLIRGTGGPSCEGLTDATLVNIPTLATVDLKKLAKNESDPITASTPGTIKPHIITSPTAAQAFIEAIVPPHAATANREFRFTVGGIEYTYKLPNNKNFVSNKKDVFNLTLAPGAPVDMHDGLSNCYIVAPSTTSDPIPIKRAITVGGMDKDATGIQLVELWDDNNVINTTPTLSGSGEDREFTVTTTSNVGNAVIALKKGSTIYWSWHIWVTNPVGEITNPHSTDYKIMDRDLGASSTSSAGLLYEWGRKDPFPYPGAAGSGDQTKFKGLSYAGNNAEDKQHVTLPTAILERGAKACVLEAIRKPTTFFVYDWHMWSTGPYDYLWWTSDKRKSVYDPCPEEWRFPLDLGETATTGGPWAEITTDFVGYHGGDGILSKIVFWGVMENLPRFKYIYTGNSDTRVASHWYSTSIIYPNSYWDRSSLNSGAHFELYTGDTAARVMRCMKEI
jgi:hypothetical protein